MANYLERVAASAGRRATSARPPNSGPPVLPASRDFAPAVEDPFASDQDQFLEPLETSAPARPEESAEIASPKRAVAEESKTITPQVPKSASSAVPKTHPPSHERLSSDAPFTVTVPRTLRPTSTAHTPSTTLTEPSTTKEEPAPIIPPTDVEAKEVNQSVVTETATVLPKPTVTAIPEEHQALIPTPRAIDVSETMPIPRVDHVDGPPRPSPRPAVAEPSPPLAAPIRVPPVTSNNTARQDQSRISIGSLEVLVNNHPKVTTARPAPAPSRSESLNLEKRYLDRFRLRH